MVEGSFDKLTTSDCFTFDVRDGRFRIFNNGQEQTPDKAVSMLSYDREKGPKILSKMPKVGNVTRAYVDAGLLQFDKIVSIDTNSKAFESDTVCVMATVMMTPSKILGNVVLKDPRTIAIEFWNPTDLPERVGWLLAMQAILDTEEYASGARFGVIIDSDLGNLENYNAREMEIVPGFVLPDQMTLIYGSADNKNDTAINKMINMTDRASNSVHRRIAAAGYVRSGDTYSTFFTDWRQWSDIELSV